jgi:hypothetical protein
MSERSLPRKVFEKPVRQELIKRRTPSTEQPMAEEENIAIPKNPYEPAWARWARRVDWKDALHKKAAHKSLDIPDDMGDINAPKTMVSNNGLGFRELLAIGALGLGGFYMLGDRGQEPSAQPVPPPAAVDTDTDTSTEIFLPQ